jgi:Protein of function (DUF2518)
MDIAAIDFTQLSQWAGIATLALGALSGLGFLLGWGLRFRMVGATGFMLVLTAGLFALGVVPFTRVVVPGAGKYVTVFDSGSDQLVISVPPTTTEEELTATLKQAAANLFSTGRYSRNRNYMTVRARTVLHPEPGVSQPLYLGEVKQSLFDRDDGAMEINLYAENLAKLPPQPPTPVAE